MLELNGSLDVCSEIKKLLSQCCCTTLNIDRGHRISEQRDVRTWMKIHTFVTELQIKR